MAIINGTAGNDNLTGTSSNDSISGYSGNDTLNGGAGSDTLVGGYGDDTYYIDVTSDVIVEYADQGIDTVRVAQSSVAKVTLSANVENLYLENGGGRDCDGNDLANSMTGNAYDNTFISFGGNDTMYGNAGNDALYSGAGDDLYYGGDGNDILDDALYSGGGNDTLDGGTGADTMKGGYGNDVYYVDNTGDVVTEGINQGTDTVYETINSYTLGVNVENLVMNSSVAVTGYGNTLNNSITGSSANNFIVGNGGNDTISGKDGNDDIICGSGNDMLYGDAGNDTLEAGAGNDYLDGGTGADSMVGGDGNDMYIVDNINDIVQEDLDKGWDKIYSSVSYTLSDNVDALQLTGSSNINGIGNNLDNMLYGNDGNNSLYGGAGTDYLDGGLGVDTMVGGADNDMYIVDNVSDVIQESLDEGWDEVYSSVSYALSDNLELLELTGSGNINATGNNLDNRLFGNSGNNSLTGGAGNDYLDGGLGADTMAGGLDSDMYIVDNINDVIQEGAVDGWDEVYASVNYALVENAEVLYLTGTSDITGAGFASQKNWIYGNDGNNTLIGGNFDDYFNGGLGIDSMAGGDGGDDYIVDNINDVVSEEFNKGWDQVYSSVSYTLSDNVELLELTGSENINATGNSSNNYLIGNGENNVLNGADGDDYLDGNYGYDTLYGGAGGDDYLLNSNSGNDTISDSSGYDIIHMDSSINKNNVAVFMSGTDLVVDYGPTIGEDKVIILGQANSTNKIEEIQLSDGTYISNTDVNQLIQTMTAYANGNNIQLTSVNDVRNNQDLMNLVAASWHS